jgi:addiction module RelE/StbE family toxin
VRKVRWTTEASDQLVAIVKRIQEDNPSAARNVAQTVIDRIENLATFPALGRLGEVKGTRELVIRPYVLVYRHTDEIVEILYIWHGAQDWR